MTALAAVTGAAVGRHPALASAFNPLDQMPADPIPADPLDDLRHEYDWAARELLAAIDTGDLSPWEAGTPEAKPYRWRLARAFVVSQELETEDPFGDVLRSQFRDLWERLSRRKLD